MHGAKTIADFGRIQLEQRNQMHGGCSTCTEMKLNGALIGIMHSTTPQAPHLIRKGRVLELIECYEVVVPENMQNIAGQPTAAGDILNTGVAVTSAGSVSAIPPASRDKEGSEGVSSVGRFLTLRHYVDIIST